jgi:DNA-binding response OmpR family regulator
VSTDPRARILLVEDEPDIAEFIALELRVEGFDVVVEADGMRGMVAARRDPPDLVILDRMVPGMDGLELCRRLRATSDVPIILLTALGQTRDRIEGLNAGANDYLPKPFDIEELIARVNAQLRAHRPAPKTRLAIADMTLDLEGRVVRRGEVSVELTPKEYELLVYLARHARQVKTRAQILESVWGYDFGGDDNVLEVTVSNLRAKLERGERSRLVHTVRGVGYVLREATS